MKPQKMIKLTTILVLVLFGMASTGFSGKLQQQLTSESTLEQVLKKRGAPGGNVYLCPVGNEG